MLETFNAFVTKINGFVWGPVMLILLVGTHVYLTFRTRSHSEKNHSQAIKLSVTPDTEASGDVSVASLLWQQLLQLLSVPVIS